MKIELNTLPAIPTAKNDHTLWNQSVKAASMLYRWKLVDFGMVRKRQKPF